MKVEFAVERETENAYEICTHSGWVHSGTKFKWVPKSICKVEKVVSTVNPVTNEPETFSTRVIEIADWWCYKNLK